MNKLGSGRGKVDCPVASKIRDVRFEPSHRQVFLNIYLLFVEKTKIKRKWPRLAQLANWTYVSYALAVLKSYLSKTVGP